MEKKNRRSSYRIGVGGILLRVALVALVLVLLSVHLMGGLFAKYTSNGEGSDEARVAKFDVEVTGLPDAVAIECTASDKNDGTYTITVTNKSEVAVEYDMIVTYDAVIDGVSATIDGKTQNTTSDDGKTLTFRDVGVLPVGTSDDTHALKFVVNWAEFTEKITGSKAEKTLNFTVTVNVVQVD